MIVQMNEYFRTKEGIIGYINEKYTTNVKEYNNWVIIQWKKGYNIFKRDDTDEIIYHSKKLSDLVIAGDFINGYRVLEIRGDKALIYKNARVSHWVKLEDKIIQEFLTKEEYDRRKFERKKMIWELN